MTAPVGAIRDALTYLARFRGSLFVIKVDDRVLESPMAAVLVHDIVLMQRMGIHAVVVAGARAAIDRALRARFAAFPLPPRPARHHRADDGARHPRGVGAEHPAHVAVLRVRGSCRLRQLGAGPLPGCGRRGRLRPLGPCRTGRRSADPGADRSRGRADRHHHRLERGRHGLQPGQRRPRRGGRHRPACRQAVRGSRGARHRGSRPSRIPRKAARRCATPAHSRP